MEHRVKKVESLIRQILAQMLAEEFIPPAGTILSLTKVSASGNLQEAKVYISVLPDQERENVVSVLKKRARFFQSMLNRKLKMRPVPKIIFVGDKQPLQAQEVETILEQLKK